LNDRSLRDLHMPPVHLVVADRSRDACRLVGFEDNHHCISRARPLEVWIDEVIAPAVRRAQNRDLPLLCLPFQPLLELLGDTTPCCG
jgi:hypothetical protein